MSVTPAFDDFYEVPRGVQPDAFLSGIATRAVPPALVRGFGSIDPGYEGAIGLISHDGRRVLNVTDTPTIKDGKTKTYDIPAMFAIAERLRQLAEVVYIERQQPMLGKGTAGEQAGFGMGFGYGIWIAVLTIARVPFVEIAPISWKTKAGVMPPRPAKGALAKLTADEKRKRTQKNREESERKTIELASTMFEGFDAYDLKRTTESEKASPDRAAALVLAHVGRRLHLGID
jgi:hypothetical protein